MNPKIALLGAGGVIFTRKLVQDILLCEALRGGEIVLMDIHAGRLETAALVTRALADKLGVTTKITATTDLNRAVDGAGYVITAFRVGNLDHQRCEYEIPRRYGVDQVVGDTLGPGGVFRSLRTLRALFEVVDAMESHCPGALLLNYVNPMSANTIALNRIARSIRVVGLCHSVPHTAATLARYAGVEKSRVRHLCAGVNHQAFFIKLEADGRDLYPALREAMNDPSIYGRDKVRFELMRHFGFFCTESSGHASEYLPYFRKRPQLVEKFCNVEFAEPEDGMPGGAMSAGVSGAAIELLPRLQATSEKEIVALLAGQFESNPSRSDEYAIQIIEAVESGSQFVANLNVMNYGLIDTLPPGCCVEVPCLIGSAGVLPCRIDNYPEQLAGLNRCMINVQLLLAAGAIDCDREKIFQAIALDPLTSAVCSLDEIRAMTDELFAALKEEIDPRFQ